MTRTNVSKLSRLERSFVAETQGPPEIPPRVPAAVVGVEVGRRAGLPVESVAPRIIRLHTLSTLVTIFSSMSL